jgi:Uma2 family endonuclease
MSPRGFGGRPRLRARNPAQPRPALGIGARLELRYIRGMADAAPRLGALWERLCALPSNLVGEIVGGELFASPRRAGPHSRVTSKLGGRLDGPFDAGEGGPGGWIILDEPELHLGDAVLVPDLAGWRRERLPHVPEELVAFELAPDWICETLSPGTGTLDRVRKMPVYAREGVPFAWLLEPIQRTLEVFQLQEQQWRTVGTWEGNVKVRAVPFDAIELDLTSLWADIRRR